MDTDFSIRYSYVKIGLVLMYYRKPKPETMKKNRELYREIYKDEIEWMKENTSLLTKHNKFLSEMYIILFWRPETFS